MLKRQATEGAEGDLDAEWSGDGHPPDDVCEGGVGRGVAGEGGDADPVEGPRVDGGGGRAREGGGDGQDEGQEPHGGEGQQDG